MKKIILAMIVLCALVAPSIALAQQTTGNINGRIVDAQGAAVPGVTVTARSPQTGFVRTDVSDGEGIYRLTALPVGNYDISAELSGFTTYSRKDVTVNVAQTSHADADLKVAVETVAQSAFFSTGQRCTASSRVIVTEGIHDKFVEALSERVRNLKVGDALEKGIEIGPVVDPGQLKQDTDYIEIGKKEGAKLAAGGEQLKLSKPGYYLQPTLFTEATNQMRISREEIFGPVASVIRVKNYEEALATSNDTEFGLSAGIVTTSLKYATHFKRNVQAGMVMVNLPTAGVDYHVPFGGRKGSSYGPREQGRYAAEFYTTVKTAYTEA